MINTLKKYNDSFMLNHAHGKEENDEIFKFTNCSSKLILSAPHATRSFCNKKEKSADLFTGAITKYLGETNNISTLIRTKFTPYKALISDYISQYNLQDHYFLDIHGFNQDVGYDICLGTGEISPENYPYLENILQIAEKYNLKTVINHINYTGKCGLTGRYQKSFKKPNVIQIELKQYLRDFYNNPQTIETVTIPLFNEIIRCYK